MSTTTSTARGCFFSSSHHTKGLLARENQPTDVAAKSLPYTICFPKAEMRNREAMRRADGDKNDFLSPVVNPTLKAQIGRLKGSHTKRVKEVTKNIYDLY